MNFKNLCPFCSPDPNILIVCRKRNSHDLLLPRSLEGKTVFNSRTQLPDFQSPEVIGCYRLMPTGSGPEALRRLRPSEQILSWAWILYSGFCGDDSALLTFPIIHM
ncbi:hypothetical protein HZ326_19320 [Fusarium oxysporum f. sp. albedinis]|nr:hypothetical protein HZ326_19320 [Fusarium oxysporum f. sp. albedinis]